MGRWRNHYCHGQTTILPFFLLLLAYSSYQQYKSVRCCYWNATMGSRSTKYFVLLATIKTYLGLHVKYCNQMWSFSTDFRKISQYQIPQKTNPSTGKRRWQMRTDGRTDMQLMGVLRERTRNSPKRCTVNCRNVTYVRIKYISDNGQCPIQYRYRKRRDQVPYAWFLVLFSRKPYDART